MSVGLLSKGRAGVLFLDGKVDDHIIVCIVKANWID